jgi:hypothetical protein
VGALRAIASGLLAVVGATVIVFIIALVALPLFVRDVLVDYMMLRAARERQGLARP